MNSDSYLSRGRRLIEISEKLKEISKITKALRNEKVVIEEDLIKYIEHQQDVEKKDEIIITVDGKSIKLKKNSKQKPINDEILKLSLSECIKDLRLVEKISETVNSNRENYVKKNIIIK